MVSVVFLVVSGVLSVTGLVAPTRMRRSRVVAAASVTDEEDNSALRSRVVAAASVTDEEDISSLKERVLELKSQVADLEEEEPKAAVEEVVVTPVEKEKEKKSREKVLSDGQVNLEALLCRLEVRKGPDELPRFARFCGFAEMAGREEEFRREMAASPYQRLPSEMPLTRLLLLAKHEPSTEWLEQAGLAEKLSAALNALEDTSDAVSMREAVHEQLAGSELESDGSVESSVVKATRSLWRDWVLIAQTTSRFDPKQQEALLKTVAEERQKIEALGLGSMTLARKMKGEESLEQIVKEHVLEQIQEKALPSFLELRFRERLRELAREGWTEAAFEDVYFAMELVQLERSRAGRKIEDLFSVAYDGVAGSYIREDFKTLLKGHLGDVDALGQQLDYDDDAQLRTVFAAKGDDLLTKVHGAIVVVSTLLSFLFLYFIFNFVLGPIGSAALETVDRLSEALSTNLDLLYGPLFNRLPAPPSLF